jgi:hypothetical protein
MRLLSILIVVGVVVLASALRPKREYVVNYCPGAPYVGGSLELVPKGQGCETMD